MTNDELIAFEKEWVHEAELELSNSLDRECRMGYGYDDMIFEGYRNILKDLFAEKAITAEEFETLKSRIRIRRPDDDNDEHRELSETI